MWTYYLFVCLFIGLFVAVRMVIGSLQLVFQHWKKQSKLPRNLKWLYSLISRILRLVQTLFFALALPCTSMAWCMVYCNGAFSIYHANQTSWVLKSGFIDWKLISYSLSSFHVFLYNCTSYRCLQFCFMKVYKSVGGSSFGIRGTLQWIWNKISERIPSVVCFAMCC